MLDRQRISNFARCENFRSFRYRIICYNTSVEKENIESAQKFSEGQKEVEQSGKLKNNNANAFRTWSRESPSCYFFQTIMGQSNGRLALYVRLLASLNEACVTFSNNIVVMGSCDCDGFTGQAVITWVSLHKSQTEGSSLLTYLTVLRMMLNLLLWWRICVIHCSLLAFSRAA